MNLETVKFRCDEVGDCWEWRSDAASAVRKRHPMTSINGKPTLMRRHAYELVHGPVGDRYVVPHCGNPECINPAHQQIISEQQKNKRGGKAASNSPTRAARVAQTRRAKGHAKINMEIANAIRMSDASAEVEAQRYGIDSSRVTQIRRGQGWVDYSNPFAGLGARA